jgi:hypothetical protein
MPQHVRMGLEAEPCLHTGPLDHAREPLVPRAPR